MSTVGSAGYFIFCFTTSISLHTFHNHRLRGEGGVGVLDPSAEGVVEDSRSTDDVVVGDVSSGASGGDDDVREALELRGDHGHVVLVEHDAGGAEARVEDGVVGSSVRVVEGEGGHLSGLGSADGQSGEGLDGEGSVAVGARGDEGRGKGVDHVKAERSVVRAAPRVGVGDGAVLPGLVTGLSGENDGSDGKVGGVGDVLGGSGVGADTNVLKNGGEGDEGGDIGVRAKNWVSIWKAAWR